MNLKQALGVMTIAGIFLVPGIALAGKSKVTGAELLFASDDGRNIEFMDGDKKVKSKVSGSRTKVMINGKEDDRDNLAKGMMCDIEYTTGGKNEPSMVDCK